MPTVERLHEIMLEVRGMLEEHGMDHSCIDAASLLASVLHGLGIRDAYRLTVGVRLYNDAFRQFADKHGFPEDETSAQACDLAGGVMIILGPDAPDVPPSKWAGHLTVVVPNVFGEKHALLDPSITQADSLKDDIRLQPLCLKVTDAFVSGKKPAPYEINRTLLVYDAHPDNDSYNDGCDVTKKEGFDMAVMEVLERLNRKSARDKMVRSYVPPPGDVGRNDPCPCGSGMKYKRCCGPKP